MSETDNAAADGPTLDAENVREPEGGAPSDGAYPREIIEARAKLASLAAGDTQPASSAADEPVADAPDASADESADTESQALRDLKAKYGGDLNKMAEGYWESSKEQSRFADELRAMRESVEALQNDRQSAIPTFEPAPEDIPSTQDLQFVTDDIATLENDIKETAAERDAIIDRAEKLKADIHRAEGRAESAEDPDEKERRKAEVLRLHDEYKSESKAFRDAKAALGRLEREKSIKQRDKVNLERRIEYERQQLIKASSDHQARIREQGQAFNGSVEAAFKATGLPESERALYGKTLTANVQAYLRSLGNAPALSTEALIKVAEAEAANLAKLHGLGQRQSFTDASKAKLAANAALKTPPANGTAVGNKPPKFNTAEEEGRWTAAQARARLAAAASRGRQTQ